MSTNTTRHAVNRRYFGVFAISSPGDSWDSPGRSRGIRAVPLSYTNLLKLGNLGGEFAAAKKRSPTLTIAYACRRKGGNDTPSLRWPGRQALTLR